MPHKFNADRRDKIPKQKHRVTNWAEYNESLRRRGCSPLRIFHVRLVLPDLVRLRRATAAITPCSVFSVSGFWNTAFKGLTEVRARSHANRVKNFLHYGRQPQKLLDASINHSYFAAH